MQPEQGLVPHQVLVVDVVRFVVHDHEPVEAPDPVEHRPALGGGVAGRPAPEQGVDGVGRGPFPPALVELLDVGDEEVPGPGRLARLAPEDDLEVETPARWHQRQLPEHLGVLEVDAEPLEDDDVGSDDEKVGRQRRIGLPAGVEVRPHDGQRHDQRLARPRGHLAGEAGQPVGRQADQLRAPVGRHPGVAMAVHVGLEADALGQEGLPPDLGVLGHQRLDVPVALDLDQVGQGLDRLPLPPVQGEGVAAGRGRPRVGGGRRPGVVGGTPGVDRRPDAVDEQHAGRAAPVHHLEVVLPLDLAEVPVGTGGRVPAVEFGELPVIGDDRHVRRSSPGRPATCRCRRCRPP